MPFPTTNATKELPAINQILSSCGQAPVTTLDTTNPDVAIVYDTLLQVNREVQAEGWTFNKENHVEFTPDDDDYINIPNNIIQLKLTENAANVEYDAVRRNGRLYDLVYHTDEFDDAIYVDAVTLYPFADLPNPFQRYITYRSAVRAATQLVSNPNLAQALQVDENKARATCLEYECEMGDHSFLGVPHEGRYQSFRPHRALRR